MRIIALCCALLLCFPAAAQLKLGATALPTLVDEDSEPARINDIVTEAFRRMDKTVSLEVMRSAFLGSGLLSKQLDGDFAYLDLDEKKSGFVYSRAYLPLYLFAVSKRESVKEISLLPHLQDKRIAIENRFANTDQVRLVKDVKWGRNPTTFDAFRQLADNRAYYLLTSGLLVDEFNRLLKVENEELLHLSSAPVFSAGFHLRLRDDVADARAITMAFGSVIDDMQKDGTFNQLLGIAWLTKDINGDGVADYISSKAVPRATLDETMLAAAYPLDDTQPGTDSVFVIDAKTFTSRQEAFGALDGVDNVLRPSLLDKEIYQRILRRW